jgi:virginiamycin B lyase
MRIRAILFLGLAIALVSAPFVPSAEAAGSIGGVVKDRSGAPVVGALVKVKHSERGVAVTVISQDGGRYQAGNLLPGTYTVQSFGGGLQSTASSVDVSDGRSATLDLAMTALLDHRKNASMAEYATLMPEGEAKTIIVSLCTDCHDGGLQEILYSRKNRDGWAATVQLMRKNPYGSVRSLDIAEEQVPVVVDYLAKNYGPDAPALDLDRMPKTLIRGASAKSMITEFDLPAGAGAHDVAVDSKGIGWVSEGDHGVIGRLDPQTFAYRRFPVPGNKPSATAIEIDPQDRVWFGDSSQNRLVMFDPRTEQFTDYFLPKPPGGRANVNTIRFHPDGTVWATGISSNQIFHLDPKTQKVDAYEVPAAARMKINATPYGMAIDADNFVWFAERRTDKVAKVNPKNGEIVEMDIPTKGAVLRRMQADKDGNLWFGQFGGVGKLAMIDYKTGKITEYPTPTKHSGAYSVDVDLARNFIWVNEMMADQIARFDPRTKTFVEYPIPTRNSSVRRIEVDPSRPSRVWFTGMHRDTVGFLDVVE